MSQEIFINVGVAEVRVAVVTEHELQALSSTRILGGEAATTLVGDIVLGRVVRVVPAVQAAFVEIGHERAGFLGAREARVLQLHAPGEPSIGELVHEGEKVLVQIVKDPIGDKGARLTAAVTTPGRYCVLTPYQVGAALSRRIEDEAERRRLSAMAEEILAGSGCGCILRTAAIGITAAELRDDLDRLRLEWEATVAAAGVSDAPATLHRDLGPIERALRDMVHDDTRKILIDEPRALERARDYCRRAMPHVENRLSLFCGPGGLFDDLESDIDGLMQPRVRLACGGWITFEATEALTAVDVNSGSFSRSSALEDTGLTVNLEAATEIGRQVRLRGVGGLIVIDFIHMREPEHVAAVLEALSQGLSRDSTPFNIGPLTSFGLIEVTRKRVREPLVDHWSEPCPQCGGLGHVRRVEAAAMEAIRRIERAARAAPGKPLELHAAPEVVRWLDEEGAIAALARSLRLEIIAEASFPRERFEVGTSGHG
ncbi:MAG TPA: Rne/Rng family ribonuclease [Rhizomicrobium sp.]|nr:Rne/Rng family ribonuclease [Rhizomicrobium sp.]